MNARTGAWRRLHPAVRVVIALVVLVVVVNIVLSLVDSSTRGSDDTAPRSSSLSTGRDGLAAYAELLRRNGHDTEAQRGDLTADAVASSDTLVVLDPVGLGRDEERAVRRFVERGGRLLAGGPGAAGLLAAVFADPPVWSSAGIRDAGPVGGAPEVTGLRSVRTAGEGSWSEPGATTPVLGNASRTLATVATVGRGRVVALADPSPLQNRLLGTADNAGFGLLAAGDGRAVAFAEGAHGYGHASGLGAIPGRWQAALVGLTLAALLGVVAAGRRLGPPEDAARPLPPPRRDYVDAVAVTLARTNQPAPALAPLQATARSRLARHAGLPPTASEAELRAAAARFGWTAAETDALFAPPSTTADVVATGRALARAADGEEGTGL
ncbi:MAG TPA: DUF4350 domain-containing protein [Acidimicrobiia bacterium]|nr:DUF4350 domain-containing protein [Acidimicrobiia bacterium]